MANSLSVTFWNVGQGDCSVIDLPDGGMILVDVGPKNSPLIDWIQEYRQMQRSLHAVIVTHNDADHVGALCSLLALARTDFGVLYMLHDRPKNDAAFQRIFGKALELERSGKLIIKRLEVGGNPIWEDAALKLKLEVIHPTFAGAVTASTANEMSGVIQLTVGDSPLIVWPGDITIGTLKKVVDMKSPQLVVGPHHGAPQDWERARTKSLLDKYSPGRVFVSVGKNKYHHPKRDYLDALASQGCRVSCSQVTSICDSKAESDGWHVFNGNSALGLPEPQTGASCRGALRLIIENGKLVPDRWDAIHSERVRGLKRPRCLKKALLVRRNAIQR